MSGFGGTTVQGQPSEEWLTLADLPSDSIKTSRPTIYFARHGEVYKMASIFVSDEWRNHPSRLKLQSLVGDIFTADGVAINLWRLSAAQTYAGLIPQDIFDQFEFKNEVVLAGMVELLKEGIYVRRDLGIS